MPDKLFFLYGAFIEKDKNFGYGDERAMTIRVAHFPFLIQNSLKTIIDQNLTNLIKVKQLP